MGSDLLIFAENFSVWKQGRLLGRTKEKEVKDAVLSYLKEERIITGKRLCFLKANMTLVSI